LHLYGICNWGQYVRIYVLKQLTSLFDVADLFVHIFRGDQTLFSSLSIVCW